ncbi:hypothetical protein OS493_010025 [Desmophyllum pertusum]|uniref:Uncharacterized protein n=1 Tax=Desmophyllum pertusum TaxID=174260 RepID=A0A9W9YHK1_9CNID|nr:hypothetical protein OS493_010025 [Desmophyllum pertusum]
MVAAPLQSNDYLIYSHLKLAIVYIWLIASCVALLSLLNKTNEKEYRLIVTDAIGIPTMLFMFLIYLRIFYLVRRCIRRDLEDITGVSSKVWYMDKDSEGLQEVADWTRFSGCSIHC